MKSDTTNVNKADKAGSMNRPVIIGVMGTTGSGKTTACGILQEQGAYPINADLISRELLNEGTEATTAVQNAFGNGIMQGENIINRRALARLVFEDEEARHKLDSIMLPRIKDEMHKRAESAYAQGHDIIIFDAPLLVEAGLNEGLKHIWLVTSENRERVARITARDGISGREAQQRIAARQSDDELKKYATLIIENNGSIDELREKLKSALNSVKLQLKL